jgi:hypothetical protein
MTATWRLLWSSAFARGIERPGLRAKPGEPDHSFQRKYELRSVRWHTSPGISGRKEDFVDTYNIYMDEAAADGLNGDSDLEVTFRVVLSQEDEGEAEENAVIVGLDLIDLLNLRDALQIAIDDFTLQAFEAVVLSPEPAEEELP